MATRNPVEKAKKVKGGHISRHQAQPVFFCHEDLGLAQILRPFPGQVKPVFLFLLALLVDVALQRQLAFPLCLRTAVLDELLSLERWVLLARAGARFEDVVVA